MDDLRTRARLVAFDSAFAGSGAIGTVVTRAEIAETAARGEFPATFLLDLDRVEGADGGEVPAHARVAVDWDEETLEQLLSTTDAPEIELWFDELELARAFDDVEGHGFRQKAAMLAVAAVAAGASATPAFARLEAGDAGGGGGGAAASAATITGSQGAQRGLQLDRQIGATQAQSASTEGGGGISSGEIAGAIAGGALLITAAGFGAARKRARPVQPA